MSTTAQIQPTLPGFSATRRDSWPPFLLRAGTIPLAITGALAATTALECHSISHENSLTSWMFSLLYGGVFWLWWALVVELVWRAGKRWPPALRVSLASLGVHLLVAVAVALAHLGTLQLTANLIGRIGPPIARAEYIGMEFFNLARFGTEFLLYSLIWFGCAAVNTQLAAQRDAVRSLGLERELARAQLQALQMQLEPHFLFNTLNAVTTLMELKRSEEALATLGHLNTVLKTVLRRNTPSKIPLAQELEMVESYLAIERVRFADRLHIDLNLDPGTLDGLVPCFLLQPIIENAIRHGVAHCERDGRIETSTRRVGDRMHLRVRDNGPGSTGSNGDSESGFGVGLVNTRERLTHFYRDDYEFRASQLTSGGYEVLITIPYERTAS